MRAGWFRGREAAGPRIAWLDLLGTEGLGVCWMDTVRRMPDWVQARCRAHNSAVECHLHTVEVVGSNPAVPTKSNSIKISRLEVRKRPENDPLTLKGAVLEKT